MTFYCVECPGVQCTTDSEDKSKPIPIFCTPDEQGEMRKPKWRKGQFYYAGSF